MWTARSFCSNRHSKLIRITEEPKPIWAAPTGRKYTSSKDKSLIAKSRHACSKAIGLGNAGAAGHVCLGTIASGTGKYEDAVEQFQSAVQLEPSNEDAYIGLGGAYEHLSKTSDAENIYKKIVQLRPKYWRGYHLLGAFFLRQAQYDDAARMFQKVVELTPERFRGYANMGATLLYEANTRRRYRRWDNPSRSIPPRTRIPTWAQLITISTVSRKRRRFITTWAIRAWLSSGWARPCVPETLQECFGSNQIWIICTGMQGLKVC